ncbi:ribose-5-phosphate isomerase [Archaeoglobus sulfaticallidus PM70-1]|uniref:Ribose-5-phosphate isomerase A n=1 Tax=Archaeoglobus sulfaticallidus PM70-1 TaxID=387631 RepID=N0BJC6_9EURY|nr:ribose-5-phosphate isomerase RpiA [Archaeoglobus sulfaticallidus]AGK60561.1 ribose-5-phosphate isomerase [Archaeoglobus sulfaticallidus PM70-1]
MEKANSAKEAARLIEDGMVIGIGSGSTVEIFLNELGKRIKEEELEIWGVPSSYQSHMLAVENGITVTDLIQFEELDLCVDGADQVDENLNCIKGKGGALLREKIVAQAAEEVIIIVDSRKIVDVLDERVPVEVFPFAYGNAVKEIKKLGGEAVLRESDRKLGACITDNGNFILDVDFGRIEDPEGLECRINCIAGVFENGIFPRRLIDRVIVGTKDGVRVLRN